MAKRMQWERAARRDRVRSAPRTSVFATEPQRRLIARLRLERGFPLDRGALRELREMTVAEASAEIDRLKMIRPSRTLKPDTSEPLLAIDRRYPEAIERWRSRG